MRALIDEDVCLGSGCCASVCPHVFKMVDGVAQVQVDVVSAKDEPRVRDAKDECPTGAIWLRQ